MSRLRFLQELEPIKYETIAIHTHSGVQRYARGKQISDSSVMIADPDDELQVGDYKFKIVGSVIFADFNVSQAPSAWINDYSRGRVDFEKVKVCYFSHWFQCSSEQEAHDILVREAL